MISPYSIETDNNRFQHLAQRPLAFFSPEYALDDGPALYAGGLGVLAGDFLLEAGAQGLPTVAVGLLYRRGFETFNFGNNNGVLIDPEKFGLKLLLTEDKQPRLLEVELGQRIVYLQVWTRSLGSVRIFLMDADVEQNDNADRALGAFLYPKDFRTKLLQEIIFGIGAVKLLRSLGIKPSLYHLNEGHTAFVVLGLVVEYIHDHPEIKNFEEALEQLKPEIVATKHTILPGAGLFFSRTDFQGTLDLYLKRHGLDFDAFCSIGTWEKEPQIFSMTKFLLASAVRANAVSKTHAIFEKEHHPHSLLFPITNAVNFKRWQIPEFYNQNLGSFSDQKLWQIRDKYRKALVEFVAQKNGVKLDPAALTVVWARRFAVYKRPTILFSNPDRLKKLVSQAARPVQLIVAGQPNISDEEGIKLLKDIQQFTGQQRFAGKLVWLPNYSLPLAKKLVQGADVWLNTPERGKEASGTSGMKSAINGGLQFSTPDGWVDELDWKDKGWILDEAPGISEKFYEMLEREIVPLFYERDSEGLPAEWIKKMRNSMTAVQKSYSTSRMFEDYFSKLYFPNS